MAQVEHKASRSAFRAESGPKGADGYRTAPRPNAVRAYLESLPHESSRIAQDTVIRRICYLLSVPGKPENVSWHLLGDAHADLLSERLSKLGYAKTTAAGTMLTFRRLVGIAGGSVDVHPVQIEPSKVNPILLQQAAGSMRDPWKASRNEAIVVLLRDGRLSERHVALADVGDLDLSTGTIKTSSGLRALSAWGLAIVRNWVTVHRPRVACSTRMAETGMLPKCEALVLSSPCGASNVRMHEPEVRRIMSMLTRRVVGR